MKVVKPRNTNVKKVRMLLDLGQERTILDLEHIEGRDVLLKGRDF